MEISFEQKFNAPDDVMFRDLDGEAVLLNLNNESYYGLDETGSRMWQVLTTSDSVGAAVRKLADEYDVDESQLRKDLIGLLDELIKNGLVQVADTDVA